MTGKKAHAMVVSPHPDDAEFGAAGTVAKWVLEGKDVVYVVCTSGDKGTSDVTMKPEVLVKIREKEQQAAARVLGVREVVFLRYPDQELEDTRELRKEIVRQIRIFRPKIVMAPDPYRRYVWHRDHRITGQVTLDAVYPYARDYLAYPDLFAAGLKPHIVEEVWLWATLEDVNHRADISDTFAIKIKALRCHKSQVGKENFSDLAGWVRGMAEDMAKGSEFKLAEAFHRVEISW